MKEKKRITVGIDIDGKGDVDEVKLYLNDAGLKEFISELQSLSQQSDHFHMFSKIINDHGALSIIPYADGEKTTHALKVLYRPDEWDKQYCPHVFGNEDE